jgi:opacity protein-like surface antigen
MFFIFAIALCLPLAAAAQETPKAEVFGGYSYFRGDLDANFHGWHSSVAGNLNNWFGVTGDVSGHYVENVNLHLFLFGPRFSYRKGDRVTPFAQTLVGAVRLGGADFDNTAFAWAAGGGFDINVSKRVAVRVIDANYILLRDNGISAHNGRLSTGIVFRLGGN